jgi:hypothetical protein
LPAICLGAGKVFIDGSGDTAIKTLLQATFLLILWKRYGLMMVSNKLKRVAYSPYMWCYVLLYTVNIPV